MDTNMRELRCSNEKCNVNKHNGEVGKPKLLGKGDLVEGSVLEIRCRCGTITQFKTQAQK